MHIPELLAPAGSIETFRAAFEAGADAFYLGYGDFNARKRARNFTEEELRLAVKAAHAHGRRVYITLNTLLFSRELPAFLDLLDLIREVRADAVIVQDIGVLSLLREFFPEIPVHASTQMFCHNSLHAAFLRDAGVSRIILPRELSLREIGDIMERVPVEYEVFVHGAMCFSFSGCCLASSWLHGESGNRGRCRQVCRHAFRADGRECYPFSMMDQNALRFVPELVRMRVASLKIEGRLKNADYVYETVSAYRATLDAIRGGMTLDPVPEISRQRETGQGYFSGGPDYYRLVQCNASGTAGEVLGGTLEITGREIRAVIIGKPVKGMRLRVQDVRGRNLYEGVLLDFTRRCEAGREVLSWRVSERVDTAGYTPPFTLYVVGRSAPADALGWLRGLARKSAVKPVSIEVEIVPGILRVDAVAGTSPVILRREYPLATEPSRSHPLSPEDCVRIFSQAGAFSLAPEVVACRVSPGLFCPVGVLKEARRTVYSDLDLLLRTRVAEERKARRAAIEREIGIIVREHAVDSVPRTFRYSDSVCPPVKGEPEFTAYPVALEGNPEPSPSPETVLVLPHFVPEAKVEDWKRRLIALAALGYTRFIVPTYGWLALRDSLPEVEFIAGSYCYAVNPFSVDKLARHGVISFVPSPDIRDEDIDPVRRFRGCLTALNAPRELFITRLSLPAAEYRLRGLVYRPRRFEDYTVVEGC